MKCSNGDIVIVRYDAVLQEVGAYDERGESNTNSRTNADDADHHQNDGSIYDRMILESSWFRMDRSPNRTAMMHDKSGVQRG